MTEIAENVVLAEIRVPDSNAMIGMTFCPGKPDVDGNQASDVSRNIDAIKAWGANAVISLVNFDEMERYSINDLGERVVAQDMAWFHHPFEDGGVPASDFSKRWQAQRDDMLDILREGGKVMVHCRGGKGRTGLICAQLMLELGVNFDDTVSLVRKHRSGALAKDSHIEYLNAI